MAADFQTLGVRVGPDTGDDAETFEVMALNWHSVKAFLFLETQWRVAAGANGLVRTGLDYAAAAASFKGRSTRAWSRLLSDLKLMETEALDVLAGADR